MTAPEPGGRHRAVDPEQTQRTSPTREAVDEFIVRWPTTDPDEQSGGAR